MSSLDGLLERSGVIQQMKSKVVQRLLDDMEKDPWHVKLKRWYRVQKWVLICRTRKFWDKDYQHYIWKKK